MIRIALILMLICLVATGFLVGIYNLTKLKIEEQQYSKKMTALKIVLKEADNDFLEKEINGFTYYEGRNKNNEVVGYCFEANGKGYGGTIRVLIGIDKNYKITGINVLEHKETPGLGANINKIGFKEDEPWFLKQFRGKGIDNLVLVKAKTKDNIQAISGATISSKAVTEAVKQRIKEFQKLMPYVESREKGVALNDVLRLG